MTGACRQVNSLLPALFLVIVFHHNFAHGSVDTEHGREDIVAGVDFICAGHSLQLLLVTSMHIRKQRERWPELSRFTHSPTSMS